MIMAPRPRLKYSRLAVYLGDELLGEARLALPGARLEYAYWRFSPNDAGSNLGLVDLSVTWLDDISDEIDKLRNEQKGCESCTYGGTETPCCTHPEVFEFFQFHADDYDEIGIDGHHPLTSQAKLEEAPCGPSLELHERILKIKFKPL